MKHHDKIVKGLEARKAATPRGAGYEGYTVPGSMNKKKSGYAGAKAKGEGKGVKHVPVDTNESFKKLKKSREKAVAGV